MKKKNSAAQALGSLGGKKTAQRGKKFYSQIGKAGHAAMKKSLMEKGRQEAAQTGEHA